MRRAMLFMTLAVCLVACAGQPKAINPESLTLIAHDSFVDGGSPDTFAGFTASTGIAIDVIAGGDAGAMVNQLVLTEENPLADVAFGVDDTFLSRAIDGDVFVEHESPLLAETVDNVMSTTPLMTSIDFGDVCINYDKGWFDENGMAVPTTLDQLRDPAYASLLTVEHPATSSPGLAFMLATISEYGLDGWLAFYGVFVLAVSVHAPIGLRAAFIEWLRWRGRSRDVVLLLFAGALAWMGMRAVLAVFA